MKSNIFRTFIATLMTTLVLFVLQWLPSGELMGVELKKVDILSDLRTENTDEAIHDTIKVTSTEGFIPFVPDSITAIEDFGPKENLAMEHFYGAITKTNTQKHPVRIAYFSDSFIEGDILTSDLREKLQEKYGGSGVGYVDIAHPTAGFRPTISTFSNGWTTYGWGEKGKYDSHKQGLSCRYARAEQNASITLVCNSRYTKHSGACEIAKIYFSTDTFALITSVINRTNVQEHKFAPGAMQEASVRGKIERVKWIVSDAPNAIFYGCAMESERGVIVDNFSLRGNNGLQLLKLSENTIRRFASFREYDLIIIGFGLNMVSHKQTNYKRYCEELGEVVDHMRKFYPQASYMFVSIGDRGEKGGNGTIETMRGVKYLVKAQREMASSKNIAFWNMFEAMGGENSISTLVNSHPAKANRDYTHINFRGGRWMAGKLYDALENGIMNYKRRKKAEDGTVDSK